MKLPKAKNPLNNQEMKLDSFPNYVLGGAFLLIALATAQSVKNVIAPTVRKIPFVDTELEPVTSTQTKKVTQIL